MTIASARHGRLRTIAGVVVLCSYLFVVGLMIWLFGVVVWPGGGFEPPECWGQTATCGPSELVGLLAVILSLLATALLLARDVLHGKAYWTGDPRKPSVMSYPALSISVLILAVAAFAYALGGGGLPVPIMEALSTHKSIAWLILGLVLLFGEFWASVLGWGSASIFRHRRG